MSKFKFSFFIILMVFSLVFSSILPASVFADPEIISQRPNPNDLDWYKRQAEIAEMERLALLRKAEEQASYITPDSDVEFEDMDLTGMDIEELENTEEILEVLFNEESLEMDEEGMVLGYDEDYLSSELVDNSDFEVIEQGLKDTGVFAGQDFNIDNTLTKDFHYNISIDLNLVQSGVVSDPMVVACNWYGLKYKPEYKRAESNCLIAGLKANYGPLTMAATLGNLINERKFKLAAWHIVKLGVRSNIAGVIVTIGTIRVQCVRKMQRLYPGRSNCSTQRVNY